MLATNKSPPKITHIFSIINIIYLKLAVVLQKD